MSPTTGDNSGIVVGDDAADEDVEEDMTKLCPDFSLLVTRLTFCMVEAMTAADGGAISGDRFEDVDDGDCRLM